MKPFVTVVYDYHDFDHLVINFRDAGIKLKFIEIGWIPAERAKNKGGGYHAVFYEGRQTDEVKHLLKEWQDIQAKS